MSEIRTPLGMTIKVTPLISACEEYDALVEEKKDLEKKIEKQEQTILDIMEASKQYEVKLNTCTLNYHLQEEKRKIKRRKNKEYNGGL